ncbi:MAG TPA: hypothetical protein VFS57_04650 [Gemmatimonadaceae bacterium]|nr:hypothetical protein [Gemmatimonadaceae bacterium]
MRARQTASPPTPIQQAVAPTRGAAGDADLRVMLSELASSKACGMIRNGFQGLRSPEHPDLVTGVLWIRQCEISNVGAHVTFRIAGNGWLWVDQTKSKSGGTFTVRQYVRFSIATTILGALDILYDRDAHVVTLAFTPDRAPEIEFKTIGDIEVDREGVWSSVIGAVGTAFASSPEELARTQATSQGTRDLSAKLARGFAVTINLCTGLRRVHIGQPPRGEMGAADIGETWRVPAEIQPGGVLVVGPQNAEAGMTLQADVSQGGARLTLVCVQHASAIANDYMAGRVPSGMPVLATVDVRTRARLELPPTPCPVVVVATPIGNAPTRFAWERPTAEIAQSTGGPMVRCRAPQ